MLFSLESNGFYGKPIANSAACFFLSLTRGFLFPLTMLESMFSEPGQSFFQPDVVMKLFVNLRWRQRCYFLGTSIFLTFCSPFLVSWKLEKSEAQVLFLGALPFHVLLWSRTCICELVFSVRTIAGQWSAFRQNKIKNQDLYILPDPDWRKEAFSGLLFIFLPVLNSAKMLLINLMIGFREMFLCLIAHQHTLPIVMYGSLQWFFILFLFHSWTREMGQVLKF